MGVLATCLGHPRIGASRELKRAVEGFWAGRVSRDQLEATGRELRRRHWLQMQSAGIDHVPCNDFSFYDHVLDAALAAGIVPARYAGVADPLARMFAMARGLQDSAAGADLAALEMTKWFDTNYHYIVPELQPDQVFRLDATKILGEVAEARALGIAPRPVVLGPVTLLWLSKSADGPAPLGTAGVLDRLVAVYEELLVKLAGEGVDWVQLDEPVVALDLDGPTREAVRRALERLSFLKKRPRLLLATYFEGLDDNLQLAASSGCEALHVDLVRAPEQLETVLAALPETMTLSVGLVDGRNVWRTDLDAAHARLRRAVGALGAERVWVAPSCSLLHVPADLDGEGDLEPQLKTWLAFARQKLDEVRALADAAGTERPVARAFAISRAARDGRRSSERVRNPAVRARAEAVDGAMLRRASPYAARASRQRTRFALPPLPTTTIGSFPQTADVRAARAAWRAHRLRDTDYVHFLKDETRRCVAKQEGLGLDVLVHGEFERTDMVEYFGEQLEGFAFTENGWVQSYGSRCVKPPILFGDVARPEPMTVDWSRFAQSLTARPMKGMLTGPVTILQWSFVRDDEPRAGVCVQVALALRDEVADLEAAGIGMIQVDEPAVREGLPLRRRKWGQYLRWAVDGFRLATAGVRDETQIHTHMCYAEFGDILPALAEMDADVVSIETSRSQMALLGDFARFAYPNEVGPGVYDIHSLRVPTADEMVRLLRRAAEVLPVERLWVNPDCGLKTRAWPEVEAALRNLVEAARRLREEQGDVPQKAASRTTSPATPT